MKSLAGSDPKPIRPSRVVINSGTARQELTVKEYLHIPLIQRVELGLRNAVVFLSDEGTQLRTLDALKFLRQEHAT